MSNLEILLEYLFEKKQGDIFGQSFDDPRKKRPINDPPEKNTPEEQKLVNKLEKWFNGHLVASSLNNFANELNDLMPLIKSGKYPELTPPAGIVYRGMKLTPEQLKNFLGLEEFNIKADEYKTINKSGILTPQKIKYYKAGKPISSWSTSPDAASEFSVTNPDVHRDEYLSVLFVANTENPFNKFFLNPDKLLYSYKKAITNYENEKEVIAVGPVKFDSVIVYSKVDIVPEDSPTAKTKKLLYAAFNNVINDIVVAVNNNNSDISKAAQKLSLLSSKKRPAKLLRQGDPIFLNIANGILEIIKRNAAQFKLDARFPPDDETLENLKSIIYWMHDAKYEGRNVSLDSFENINNWLGDTITYKLGYRSNPNNVVNHNTLANRAKRVRLK
ncbi:hypothetical protein EBR43_13000 [bacterium]|nr:hypothetical protein [bacterium]